MPMTRVLPGRVRRTAVLAAAVTLVWSTGACGGTPSSHGESAQHPPTSHPTTPAGSPSAPAVGGSMSAFYHQKLAWHPCTGGTCATMTVPLDYAHPAGKTIHIAVFKAPAPAGHSQGALVVNPGGPGGSGISYAREGAAAFGPVLPKQYDIVGFDPRGVGQSTPLRCEGTAGTDQLIGFNPAPSTKAARARAAQLFHAYGEACLRHSGALVAHVSTVEAARDMDVLRSALGEPKLTYFGASYGTLLGATYANLFPHRVGRMVLDGAVDPALSTVQLSLAQAHGFQVALDSYIRSCVSRRGCILGNTVAAGRATVDRVLAQIDRQPLPTMMGRKLTEGWAVIGVWLPLYVKSYWPLLTDALTQAIQQHNGSALMTLADAYASRGPNGYTDNSFAALNAVNCLDHDDWVPMSKVTQYLPEFEKASPSFGKDFALGLSACRSWPVQSHHRTTPLHAKGAPPIVVLGTTRDPATPLAWAKALAHQLASGVLVTRNGDGHTAFNRGNPCIDTAVVRYLVNGVVPRNGLAC